MEYLSGSRICISCLKVRRIRSLGRTCSKKVCVNRALLSCIFLPEGMAARNCCKKFAYYLGFSGESVQRFTLPQAKWPLAPILWSVYRTFLAIYMMIWLILILVQWGEPPFYSQADTKAKWLIYVSNWSFLSLILYLTVMAIGNIYYHARNGCKLTKARTTVDPESDSADPEGIPMSSSKVPGTRIAGEDGDTPLEPLPWYFKFAWYLQSVAFTSGMFVALNFYILVFDPSTSVLSAYNFHVHGVNLIVIILDMTLSAVPVRVLHMIYPSTFALVYFIFTLIYEAAGGLNETGGTYIYRNYLDWATVPTISGAIMAAVVLVAAPVLHLIWYAFFRIREAISKCCKGCCWTY